MWKSIDKKLLVDCCQAIQFNYYSKDYSQNENHWSNIWLDSITISLYHSDVKIYLMSHTHKLCPSPSPSDASENSNIYRHLASPRWQIAISWANCQELLSKFLLECAGLLLITQSAAWAWFMLRHVPPHHSHTFLSFPSKLQGQTPPLDQPL
jgi:hypothetical protein